MRVNPEDSTTPDDILEAMRHQRPKLYQYFRPTPQQLAFYLVSSCRRGDLGGHSALLAKLLEATAAAPQKRSFPSPSK
jgi:hypothetical protein